jgi:hypothetical protein
MSKRYKHIAFWSLAFILALSMFIQPFDAIKIKQLKGYFVIPEDSSLSMHAWFDNSFQQAKEESFKHTLKTRPWLVRVYNQMHYWLFQEISARNVAIGKDDYYYEKHYIAAYLGLDFIGEDSIKSKIAECQRLVDSLNSNEVEFLLVLAPGKASVFPEYLPEEFDNYRHKTTNYEIFIRELKKSRISYIDFNNYFLSIKDTVHFPIYPKGGTHWSIYGSFIAIDTIVNYIEYLTKLDLPDYDYPAFDITKKPRKSDNDIAKATNRIFVRYNEKLLYPYFQVSNEIGKDKPRLLTVGDSYYWMIVGNGVQKKLFSEFNFWYYFKENHGNYKQEIKSLSQFSDLKEEIERKDIVVLLITEGNLNEFSWGFVESILELYDH